MISTTCNIIKASKNLSDAQKLDKWISLLPILRTFLPDDKKSDGDPVVMTLLDSETRPLDGYNFTGKPLLPDGLDPGTILPAGGRTRIVIQAANTETVTEVDRISLLVTRQKIIDKSNLTYVADPTRQPGFGPPRPHRFNIRLEAVRGSVIYYINDAGRAIPIKSDNLLAGRGLPLLRFDRNVGLQETLDVVFVAATSGLYELRFVAHAISQGREYDIQTQPIYVVRL